MIVSDKEQTISRAKDLAERLDKVDVEGLDLIETILQSFPTYPLEKLEDLADALLDFNAMPDLETWLAAHIRKLTL